MNIPDVVLSWLLEDNNQPVKYRALTELLQLDDKHPDVVASREQLAADKTAQKIMAQIRNDGEWHWIAGYDSPEYGISYLGELGLSNTHPKVAQGVDVYLSKQQPDGGFPNSYLLKQGQAPDRSSDQSCYYALTLRGLLRLGYRDDPRVRKALSFMLTKSRWDGGYSCSMSYVKDTTKSCIRGSKNILLLFAELPELWETAQCGALVEYFLSRNVFYRRDDPTKFVRERPRAIFPFHYRFGVVEPLYALSKMGYGHHPALTDGWQFLNEKRDATGRYVLDWTVPKCAFNVGNKGQANKWVTLYAYLALKYRESARPHTIDIPQTLKVFVGAMHRI